MHRAGRGERRAECMEHSAKCMERMAMAEATESCKEFPASAFTELETSGFLYPQKKQKLTISIEIFSPNQTNFFSFVSVQNQ